MKHVIDAIRESKERHAKAHGGWGLEANRAHLEEMLRRDDVPPFVRVQMQRALNRHLMMERMTAHEHLLKGQQEPTT